MSYRVSLLMEAYNEEQTALTDRSPVVAALLRQDFPLKDVEFVLLGTARQLEKWKEFPPSWQQFGSVRLAAMDMDSSHYWEQKNFGTQVVASDIVAFLDSDVIPESTWLSSIVQNIESGADVSVGPSLLQSDSLNPYSPLLLAAASVSWGFVLSVRSWPGVPLAASLLSHNVAMRREVALRIPYRTGRRSFQSSLLYFDLVRHNVKIVYHPGQRAAHYLSWGWWLSRRHFRSGWETDLGRQADPMWPRILLLEKIPWLEPPILRGGMVLRDVRHWFRFRRVVGVGTLQAWLMVPLILVVSAAARTAEMTGMYCARLYPKATEHQARF